ncbi:MAG: DUF1559 domain-containing protein [Planctomycetaceae bacterium]|nr:DUF1559 domain-containing protein [Planctomycetaceae bacterium]
MNRQLFNVLIGLLVVMYRGDTVANDATIVQPFVGETTLLILKVDPTKLSLPADSAALKSTFPGGPEAYDRWAHDATRGVESLRAATDGESIYATIGVPLSKSEWPAYLFAKESSAQSRTRFTEFVRALHEIQSCTQDGFTVIAPIRNVDVEASLKSLAPSPRTELATAFESVQDYSIQVLLLPPDYVRRTVTELMPLLPRHLGGGPSSLLTDGVVWASLGVNPAGPRARLVIQSKSEAAARNLAAQLPKMLATAYDELPAIQTPISRDDFQRLLPFLKPTANGSRVTIELDEPQSIREGLRLVAAAPATVAEQIRRRTNSDRFKQILLAMHNYHDTFKSFPPGDAFRDARGKSGFSWRVYILPFLDQADLYNEFDLDQPWDSPHNKPLIEKMPKVYESPWLGITPGHTTFLAPVGEDTIFGGDKPISFRHILDGTSNTAMLVEVEPRLSVPWTAPLDYQFDAQQPGAGVRVGTDGRFLAALADGSVNMFRGSAAPELLIRLFQKSDGNPFSWSELR